MKRFSTLALSLCISMGSLHAYAQSDNPDDVSALELRDPSLPSAFHSNEKSMAVGSNASMAIRCFSAGSGIPRVKQIGVTVDDLGGQLAPLVSHPSKSLAQAISVRVSNAPSTTLRPSHAEFEVSDDGTHNRTLWLSFDSGEISVHFDRLVKSITQSREVNVSVKASPTKVISYDFATEGFSRVFDKSGC